jgi:hypothetical protein
MRRMDLAYDSHPVEQPPGACLTQSFDGTHPTTSITGSVSVLESRGRYWYFVISKCRGQVVEAFDPGVYVYYELHATNPGGNEFSADEFGLFEMHMIAALYFFGLLVVCAGLAVRWSRLDVDLIVLRLVVCIAITVCFVACHACMLHRGLSIVRTGWDVRWAGTVAEVCESLGQLGLTLLVMLTSTGWMVTHGQLQRRTQILHALGIAATGLAYAVLIIVERYFQDEMSAVSRFDSNAFIAVASVKMILFLWCLAALRRTYGSENRPHVRQFYMAFAVTAGWWLLAMPLCALLARLLPPSRRLNTCTILLCASDAVVMAVLCMLQMKLPTGAMLLPVSVQLTERPLTSSRAVDDVRI